MADRRVPQTMRPGDVMHCATPTHDHRTIRSSCESSCSAASLSANSSNSTVAANLRRDPAQKRNSGSAPAAGLPPGVACTHRESAAGGNSVKVCRANLRHD
jgi:hypothetical protein